MPRQSRCAPMLGFPAGILPRKGDHGLPLLPRERQILDESVVGLLAPGLATARGRCSYQPRLLSPSIVDQWLGAAFVPGYSGGAAPDSHRIPCSVRTRGPPPAWRHYIRCSFVRVKGEPSETQKRKNARTQKPKTQERKNQKRKKPKFENGGSCGGIFLDPHLLRGACLAALACSCCRDRIECSLICGGIGRNVQESD